MEAWLSPKTLKPSTSDKKWPKQSDHGRQAWNIWKKFLINAFATSEGGKLRQPLGKWIARNDSRIHQAYSDGRHLYVPKNGAWHQHAQTAITRRQMLFQANNPTLQENLPDKATPTDIITITAQNIVTGRNEEIMMRDQDEITEWTIVPGITITANDLILNHVKATIDSKEFKQTITSGKLMEIATDGGYDPSSGISKYGWVIAVDKQVVAMGRGPAAAHPIMAESFRAEGFGIASAASFLKTIIQQFQMSATDFTWKVYIDNQAMIRRMESYRATIPSLRWNLRPDADITNLANKQIRTIPAQYIHVKSHQDANKGENLSYEAQLNIMADELATQQRRQMTEPLIEKDSLGSVLKLDGTPITRDSQRWLLGYSSRGIPIIEYYRRKFSWTKKTFHTIAWDIQRSVLKKLEINDQ
jgi:hypothetical protein